MHGTAGISSPKNASTSSYASLQTCAPPTASFIKPDGFWKELFTPASVSTISAKVFTAPLHTHHPEKGGTAAIQGRSSKSGDAGRASKSGAVRTLTVYSNRVAQLVLIADTGAIIVGAAK